MCAGMCAALSGCVTAPSASEPPSLLQTDRQLLVMLRTSPPHFRPDRNYSGVYGASGGGARAAGAQLAREHGLTLLDEWPMPALGVDCLVMQAADAAAVRNRIDELSHDPRVSWVQPMHAYHLLGGDPLSAMQPAARPWRLDALHRIATGRGVVVAEVDSGVDASHPDLRGQIAQSRNFVDAGPVPAENHGTEVAGIIAAVADNGIGIAGVAPQARLLALRACWQVQAGGAATCNSFTLAKALQFALQADPQVLNLSLGGPRDELLTRLLDLAVAQDIVVVGAADPDPANAFPARHPGVLAVATDEETDAVDASDLRAPGRDIPTTVVGGGWEFVRGSSFAAAEVSGLVALLRQLSPRADAAAVRAALQGPVAVGLGVLRPTTIDPCAAAARLGAHCACDCAVTQVVEKMPRH
ncbi:MAG: S8 family serine peptidase [Proteobacteria bacterium]|nr:S8 family serine peptidase [Pseudomonadota bacterium]